MARTSWSSPLRAAWSSSSRRTAVLAAMGPNPATRSGSPG